jgi:hypothetical protein
LLRGGVFKSNKNVFSLVSLRLMLLPLLLEISADGIL